MRSDELLQQTLEATGLPVKQYEYKGTKSEYILFNEEDERSVLYADNRPMEVSLWWQVHLFTPKEYNYRFMKRKIRNLLLDAGFSVREAITIYEEETETIHVVMLCHTIEEMEEE